MSVTLDLRVNVALIKIDNGKADTITTTVLADLHAAFDKADATLLILGHWNL